MFLGYLSNDILEFTRALGMPENLRSFKIECKVGEVLTIECSYLVDETTLNMDKLKEVTGRYRLQKIED